MKKTRDYLVFRKKRYQGMKMFFGLLSGIFGLPRVNNKKLTKQQGTLSIFLGAFLLFYANN
jgi:hypothetical protein